MGEGNHSGDEISGASYLPEFEFIDMIRHPEVKKLEGRVSLILDSRGLHRLRSDDLSTILPSRLKVPTVLANRVFRHFDALFYWED